MNKSSAVLALTTLTLGLGLAATSSPLHAADLSAAQNANVAKAHRREQHGWIFLKIQGSAHDRGFQHGFLLAREIAEEIRVRRREWEFDAAMDWDWLVKEAVSFMVPRTDAENLAEMEGIAAGMTAAGSATTRDDILTYNAYIELSGWWWPGRKKELKSSSPDRPKESCSAFIAAGSLTRDGGIVLGHNTMFDYAEATANVVLDLAPETGHRILMQTFPGMIHSATDFFITSAGLVGCETTIGGFDGFDTNGVPEFVRMRQATQYATNLTTWCEIIQKGNNGGYANAWLLGDVNTGEIARFEQGLKHTRLERTRDGFFCGSNVAEDSKILRFETSRNPEDIRSSSVARRVRWGQLMGANKGKVDVKFAKKALADHYDNFLKKSSPGARSLCGHFELDATPGGGVPYSPSGTFDAKVVDSKMAKEMAFAGRWGSACGKPFNTADFLKLHPQFEWRRDIMKDRPTQPWTEIRATPAR